MRKKYSSIISCRTFTLLGIVVAGAIIHPAALFAQNGGGQSGYVCEQINPETGNCDFWRQIYIPPSDQQVQNYGYYSYGNEYRRPPAQARLPANQGNTQNGALGSSFLPSREYAPGFGTSFAAPQDFGKPR